MTDETPVVETGVEDHIETLAAHINDSDAEDDVHEALTAVIDKVNSLTLGAETDAKTIAEQAEALANKTVTNVASMAKEDAQALHVDLTAVKADIAKTNSAHVAIAKLEAILAKIEAFITKEL